MNLSDKNFHAHYGKDGSGVNRQQDLNGDHFIFELKKMNLDTLDKHLTRLNFLASKFDPFSSLEGQPIEVQNLLDRYELNHLLNDPYQVTKVILRMLDNLNTEKQRRTN